MFKSKKKKQQEKQQREAAKAAKVAANESVNKLAECKLLDDIKLSHDFRSSVILPQLSKERKFNEMAPIQTTYSSSLALDMNKSPTSPVGDASKQYKELADWRHQRNQNRYSNSLFGGKQRGKLTPSQLKKTLHTYDKDQVTISENDTFVHDDLSNISASLNQMMDDDENEQQIDKRIEHVIFKVEEEEDDDYEFEQDEYEPDSDEENFFFQDFSNNAKPKQKQSARRKRKSTKFNNQFNLSSFAKDLHDNRLSVIQPRESRIIMTEADEEELERLLHLQRQRMSMMTINESTESLSIPPPMPSLEKMKQFEARDAPSPVPLKKESIPESLPPLEPPAVNEDSQPLAPLEPHTVDEFTPLEPRITRKVSRSEPLAPPEPRAIKQEDPVKKETLHKSSSLQKKPSFVKDRLPPPPPVPSFFNHESVDSNKIELDDEEDEIIDPINEKVIKRSISTASIKTPTTPKILRSSDQRKQKARRSMSLDDMTGFEIPSATSAWIEQDTPTLSTSLKPKSRGLFGSLRQVSRSKTHHSGNHVNPIRGLVRNMSTNSQPTPGMSRAAMAVIQHNVAQHEQKQGKDVISQFISRASSTKIVNMEDKKRNEVVRRTIIYVQPNSLHQLLKNGGDGVNVPPVPNRNTVMSEESHEEVLVKKATKISRQTSVRKKVVENQKRWQLQSMDEDEMLPHRSSTSSSSSSSSDSSYMEGVELREMSDGSVMWGIVKKQGNRKSFYAHKKDQFELVDEVDIKPPPIPKRSPHRQPSSHKRKEETTNIYYSNDVTLPNLLKLMNDQYPGDTHQRYLSEKSMDSVDNQLDEMIKHISSQK